MHDLSSLTSRVYTPWQCPIAVKHGVDRCAGLSLCSWASGHWSASCLTGQCIDRAAAALSLSLCGCLCLSVCHVLAAHQHNLSAVTRVLCPLRRSRTHFGCVICRRPHAVHSDRAQADTGNLVIVAHDTHSKRPSLTTRAMSLFTSTFTFTTALATDRHRKQAI